MWCNYCKQRIEFDDHVILCKERYGHQKLFDVMVCCLCFETLTGENIARQNPKEDVCQTYFNHEAAGLKKLGICTCDRTARPRMVLLNGNCSHCGMIDYKEWQYRRHQK